MAAMARSAIGWCTSEMTPAIDSWVWERRVTLLEMVVPRQGASGAGGHVQDLHVHVASAHDGLEREARGVSSGRARVSHVQTHRLARACIPTTRHPSSVTLRLVAFEFGEDDLERHILGRLSASANNV